MRKFNERMNNMIFKNSLYSLLLVITLSVGGFTQAAISPSNIISGGVHFAKQPGDTRSDAQFQADCSAGIGLSSCVAPSTPNGCPDGKVWSNVGSGIAHCVGVDPLCGSGADMIRDALGNPSCVGPTTSTESRVEACPAGYSGYMNQQRTVSTRATGAVEYGTWTTVQDLCVPPPPAPPPAPPPEPPAPPPPPEPVTPTPVPEVKGLHVFSPMEAGALGVHWQFPNQKDYLDDTTFNGNPKYKIIMMQQQGDWISIGIGGVPSWYPGPDGLTIKSFTINGKTHVFPPGTCAASQAEYPFTWCYLKAKSGIAAGNVYPYSFEVK